ncbi:MAG: hypothetical protein SFY56_05315 [Bacteroidota bacterium]|nr:hypothetical protein [Bacteroidota bacterium]
MLNKIGKYLLVGGLVVIAIIIVISIWFGSYFESLPQFLFIIILLTAIIAFSLSFSFIYYNSDTPKRKKAITVLSIISSIILLFGMYSKFMHWVGASAEVILSIFLFCFGCLPLIIKGRYQKRKLILSNTSLIWSFTDLFAILFLFFGALFKFMHWPGWYYLTVFGIIFLVISIFGWNISFKKEVTLKLKAEEELKETLKNLEEKNRLIEEKQKEILDSIKYAKRIQNAHLPNEGYLNRTLNRLNKDKA